jgi:hypothetical protein
MPSVEQEIRTILKHWSSSPISERGSPCSICSFLCSVLWTFVGPFVFFSLAIVLSVHLFCLAIVLFVHRFRLAIVLSVHLFRLAIVLSVHLFRLAIVLSVHRFTVSDYSLINANCSCTKPTRND